jgi:hypothetical protein
MSDVYSRGFSVRGAVKTSPFFKKKAGKKLVELRQKQQAELIERNLRSNPKWRRAYLHDPA